MADRVILEDGKAHHFICNKECKNKHQNDFCYSFEHARSLGWAFYRINNDGKIYADCPVCSGVKAEGDFMQKKSQKS